MPIYEFKCSVCGAGSSINASMDSDIEAPKCTTDGIPMTRDFSTPAIIFKGSGFYKTDSKK
jgi:putative FmdB family regulatory protein